MIKITFLVVIVSIAAEQDGSLCTSQQYLELGRSGTLHCDFGERFIGVFWYNSTDYLNEQQQLIYITNKQKGGAGYLSGEFDILPNGSLVINNVTLQHNHGYTVIMFRSKTDETVPIYVNVVVIVKPKQTFPTISKCGGEQICFIPSHGGEILYCYLNDSLPGINLTFAKRTSHGDQQLTSAVSLQIGNPLHTSVAGINLPVTEVLTLYVCKADLVTAGMLANDESAVLVETDDRTNVPSATIIHMFAERNSDVELKCSHNSSLYMVWSTRNNKTTTEHIAYSVLYDGQRRNTAKKRYKFMDNYTLTMPHVTVQDEGMYQCVASNGIMQQVFIFDVTVFVTPSLLSLMVDGCRSSHNCVLSVKRTGRLTCRLRGTRPVISLQWRFVGSLSQVNKFYNGTQTVEKRDGSVFDIKFIADYYIYKSYDDAVTVECFVIAEEHIQLEWLNLSMRLNLQLPFGHKPSKSNSLMTIPVILGCLAVVIIIIIILFCEYKKRNRCIDSTEQNHPMEEIRQTDGENSPLIRDEDQLNTFRGELTKRYREICERTKLLPNDIKTYCIDDVFVESSLKKISMSNSHAQGMRWIAVDSYHEIIDPVDTNCYRIIVQGESGFGKTLLCRKIAYDWYSRSTTSPFGSIDILIYLPVRLLGGLTLCAAITKHLLPPDTNLKVKDIQYLLSTYSSVLVFDGFNRFPLKETYKHSELHHILINQAFQNSQVILTSLPDSMPTSLKSAKRMRLVGFSETAREKYICDVVAKTDSEGQKAIDFFLKSSPDILQLCHIPLFFALLSNLYHNGKLQNLYDAKRVTEVFKSIVSGLAANEEELNVSNTQNIAAETDSALEEESFKLLTNRNSCYRFDKSDLLGKLGGETYMKYIRMGLLNEDKVVRSADARNESDVNVSYMTEVRYYHSIFLEWYAGQYLSRIGEELKFEKLKGILDNIDPVNHQYVFRFACGLNEKAAFNIVKYLERKRDFQKFAKLCIVEQTGSINKIKGMIERLCSVPVVITEDDSVLEQRSLVQLLELAAKNDIHIEVLWLQVSAIYFNDAQETIEFGAGVQLPRLDTLQQFSISASMQFTEDEFTGLLRYASSCKKLMSFRLRGCVLPARIQSNAMAVLIENDVSVEWILPVTREPRYILNLKSGYWENKEKIMTDKEYELVKTVLGFSG